MFKIQQLLQRIIKQCSGMYMINWVGIACNNLNIYTYKKLQNNKSPWYCICCLHKKPPYYFIDNDVLNSFMHENRILSPNAKFISSVMKQIEYFDEEVLEKVNNIYYTPIEFNNALNELNTKKQSKTFICI